MEGVVEFNHLRQTGILNPCHRIPQYLYQTYSMEVSVTLWYQEDGLSGTLIQDITFAEGVLDKSDGLLPVGGVV